MLVCEGYVDVIAMHQAGFTNAVASLGTAFTSQHAMLLKRYTDKVYLAYDSDGAGIAASPKSNSAYLAINSALEYVSKTGNQPVPLHLRNAPTKLMKDLGYGTDYKYPHVFPNHFVHQQYLPDACNGIRFWNPDSNPQEAKLAERLSSLWQK